MPDRSRAVLLAVLLIAALPLAAQEKSLRWSEVAARPRLDAQGTLHVAERQAMVFTGDWNGGYRSFRLGVGQKVHLERLVRIEPTGEEIPLVAGDTDEVDHFAWKDSTTLRGRSRRPSDPPFE